ncbi:unnamed protein product [Caenorhabditis auriculariae]|uniref:C2H2-type domain-containing protein n=1 Tax=Caenorhabditis auriculariae TaxID=2777116 RepID=A0A8S1HFU6_9PELO|nr:unnamed protein product [Caenorhabditis auriculariae]
MLTTAKRGKNYRAVLGMPFAAFRFCFSFLLGLPDDFPFRARPNRICVYLTNNTFGVARGPEVAQEQPTVLFYACDPRDLCCPLAHTLATLSIRTVPFRDSRPVNTRRLEQGGTSGFPFSWYLCLPGSDVSEDPPIVSETCRHICRQPWSRTTPSKPGSNLFTYSLNMSCAAIVASLANVGKLDMNALLTNALQLQTEFLQSSDDKGLEVRRKRRRGEVANPANTLDALVARKADDCTQPFEKRYLSEQEAIEGPDDEIEMKKMEHDPDVSTRTCSTCGYQGKWVSEMIRHKRVHTSERPFKCRYCSRTSKWKADLIRHVAKTHGIRVVSKYSRSKTFDSSAIFNKSNGGDFASDRQDCEMDLSSKSPLPYSSSSSSSSDVESPAPPKEKRVCNSVSGVSYRCVLCGFEDERVSVLTQHVRRLHDTSPYVCRCGDQFDDLQAALGHSGRSCPSYEIVFNVIPNYLHDKAAHSPCESNSSGDSGVNMDVDETETPETPLGLPSSAPFSLFSPLQLQTPMISPTIFENSLLQSPFDLQAALMALQSPLAPVYLASLTSLLASPTVPLASPTSMETCSEEHEELDVEQ